MFLHKKTHRRKLKAMKIYDISQEVFSCVVFGKDPAPKKTVLASIKDGSPYNLIEFSMCAHNGTHIDAPSHFIEDGKTIEQLSPDRLVGYAYVAEHTGNVTEEDIKRILARARMEGAAERILIKGKAALTLEAAKVLSREGVYLFGNESQTVGPENAPMAVHLELLSKSIALLEGVRLNAVSEGVYFLSAAPLNLAGADGSPCRAVLIDYGDL